MLLAQSPASAMHVPTLVRQPGSAARLPLWRPCSTPRVLSSAGRFMVTNAVRPVCLRYAARACAPPCVLWLLTSAVVWLWQVLDDGFVQAVVLCRSSDVSTAQETALQRLVAAASPCASLMRAPRSARSAGAELGAMMRLPTETTLFDAPAMQAARAVSSPAWAAGLDAKSSLPPAPLPNPALEGIVILTVPTPPALSLRLLEEKASALFASPSELCAHGKPPSPQLILMHGVLMQRPDPTPAGDENTPAANDDESAIDLTDAIADKDAPLRMIVDMSSSVKRKPYGADATGGATGIGGGATGIGGGATGIGGGGDTITVVARGIDAPALATLLLSCRPLPPMLPRVTRSSLTPLQMSDLRHDVLHNSPLPDDVFFDGRLYVSMDGDRSEDHPELGNAVEKLLATLNESVDAANGAADAAAAAAEVDGAAYLALVAHGA